MNRTLSRRSLLAAAAVEASALAVPAVAWGAAPEAGGLARYEVGTLEDVRGRLQAVIRSAQSGRPVVVNVAPEANILAGASGVAQTLAPFVRGERVVAGWSEPDASAAVLFQSLFATIVGELDEYEPALRTGKLGSNVKTTSGVLPVAAWADQTVQRGRGTTYRASVWLNPASGKHVVIKLAVGTSPAA
jgi:hypothetical protein